MKRNYWPLFFIGIFSFTFSMIIWTIVTTSKKTIYEDKSFFQTYQEIDDNYNNIVISNMKFKTLYDLKVIVNKKEFDLTIEDIKYSQRVLEKISKHKNLFNLGDNVLKVYAIDKKTNEKKDMKISLKITKSNTSVGEFILSNDNFENKNQDYISNFKINEENNWNITGTFEIDGNIGYIYLKSNAS